MPRPSDVYATLGAPGVYQSTPYTPSRLPDVYLFPPEEDDEDVHCLFHSGSVSPTTFESFYRHPAYSQREPNSPTFTDLRALDRALSYFQRQSAVHSGARYSWEHDGGIQRISRNYPRSTASSASSRSSLSDSLRGSSEIEAETTTYSNTRYQLEVDGLCEHRQHQPASRRSSFFGDRPPAYEAIESRAREEDRPVVKKSQTMSIRTRAAMALKGLSGAMPRRTDGHVPDVQERGGQENADADHASHESWFEPKRLLLKRSRRALAQLVDSHVDVQSAAGDVNFEVAPSALSSSVRNPKLLRRRSVTQLFGLGRASMESATKTHNSHLRLDMGHPATGSSSPLVSPTRESRLSRRRSMTQIFGLSRGASLGGLSDHTIVAVDADETSFDMAKTSLDIGSRVPEEPHANVVASGAHTIGPASLKSDSAMSLATSGKTTPAGKRKSFRLSKAGFSFLDFHRPFATDHTTRSHSQAQHIRPAADPAAHFSPDSSSERTDFSSFVTLSTKCDQMVEDNMHLSESCTPAIMQLRGEALAMDLGLSLSSPRAQLDLNEDLTLSPTFGLEIADDDGERGTDDGPPALDLAGLDSLTFDELIFDPDSFTDSISLGWRA